MQKRVSCRAIIFDNERMVSMYRENGDRVYYTFPGGGMEKNETEEECVVREVKEETGASAKIIKYIGKTVYTFKGSSDIVNKTVHWYLMTTDSFYCKPQAEEFFVDAGYYKEHEAYHLLKFNDEKQIMKRAYAEYMEHRKRFFTKNKNHTRRI